MSSSKVKIHGTDLQITLEGDSDQVFDAYEALSPMLSRRLEATMEAHRQHCSVGPAAANPPDMDITQPMHRPVDRAPSKLEPPSDAELIEQHHLADQQRRFITYASTHRQVATIGREQFDASILSRLIDYRQVHTFHVSEQAARRLEGRLASGEPLWRELNPRGQATVSDDGDSS